MASAIVAKGLAGVLADYTAVSTVGKHEAGLTYRGYAIEDLAEKCEFEEVAQLLIHGSLPTKDELVAYKARLAGFRSLPEGVIASLEALPREAHPMDVLRTCCSVLGCIEPEEGDARSSQTRDLPPNV
jgi:2-methylcitrate synthase